jgi:outer membrane protein assembly factor BamD (BamD/ComL family)
VAPRVAPRHLPLAALALLGVALVAPQSAAQGRVDVLNKERAVLRQANAVVQSETLDTVKFVQGRNAREFATSDVVYIDYGKGSTSYERGLVALAEGDLLNAETLFGAASKDTDPPWVAAHALLKQAESAARRGTAGRSAAQSAISEFLTRFPDHRLLPEALLARARYAAAGGDKATMQQSVDAVVDLSRSNRVTPDWAARAHLLAGDLLLEAADADGATRAYGAAESAVTTGTSALGDRPDLKPVLERIGLAARTGTASCMLASDDVAGARSYYTRLASDGKDDPAVQAAARNGLAECDFREDGKLKEAQLGFAKVAITSVGTPTEHARALFFLGRCSEELDKAGREPGGRSRAISYFQEVADRYPETRWGRLALQSLP